jgi:hypothetical protein
VRRLVLLLAVLALAGCGGDEAQPTTVETVELPTTPTTTTSGDPGKDAIAAFIAAARAGDVAAMRRQVSAHAKAAGPVRLAPFVKSLGSLGSYKVIVSERITPELGVVAVDDGETVYAVPLRLEGDTWKVEAHSPVVVRPIGPDPGAVEKVVGQVAASVQGPGGTGTAVMYLDGLTENPEVRGTPSNATLFANFDPTLPPGRHTVVVIATDGRDAGATGWAFRVKKKAG